MFTTLRIHKLLSENNYTRNVYKGVYPIDRLPQFGLVHSQKPAIIIVNLSKASASGSHWILVYFPQSGPAYIFDSFGRDIKEPELETFIARNSKHGQVRNKQRLQNERSITCGKFVVIVAYLLARGVFPEQITLFFTRNTNENERRVEELMNHIFT